MAGSDATWTSAGTATAHLWVGFQPVLDALRGVDFAPSLTSTASQWRLDATRPAVLWELSTLTASHATGARL